MFDWFCPETGTDGYKIDHLHQYLGGTRVIGSNLTPRKTRRPNVNKVVFALFQYFLKEYLIKGWNENFFNQDIEVVVKRFRRRMRNYAGPSAADQIGDEHIRALHKLGYLPLKILALPEGTMYPLRVPSVVVWNTNPEFFWLTNYIETIFSNVVWGGCTSATTAAEYKKLLKRFAFETVGDDSFVQWQGHDFSFRGMFGFEAACISGSGHLLSFVGTDTIPAIDFLEHYYNADSDKEVVGNSVFATEHSVACSTILDFVRKVRIENANTDNPIEIYDAKLKLADIAYVKRLITEVYPKGIISIVSDSFDYWNTITHTARVLKDVIMARDGKVVFRPDTGDPIKIVCGYESVEIPDDYFEENETCFVMPNNAEAVKYKGKYYPVEFNSVQIKKELSEHEVKGSIECLWDIFGGTDTAMGYRLLDSHVGLIYGDSITLQRAEAICVGLKKKRFASINIVFGIGSYTYQYVTRDTDGYAVKATYADVDGEPIEIYKDPKTDDGTKKSAKGLTAVFKDENGEFYLKDQATWEELLNCELKPVFENGKLLKDWTLAEVRANLNQYV